MAGRRLPSSQEDESSSDDSEPRREAIRGEAPPSRREEAPSGLPEVPNQDALAQKKCPTCGECFGTAKAGAPTPTLEAHPVARVREHRGRRHDLKREELRERLVAGLSSEGLKKELPARLLAEYPGSPAIRRPTRRRPPRPTH